ncbi:NAD+ diphosphatase [Wolfiporia cocos MD-104 SS10]|uniref:NAD(+) diphosphatase n=1 Tax=Wolfiporia cocos (strain MD-104) TaxID=742152 RepID=A0A2H3J2T9_WOLCO|nr:NAD+ diphosphatase [Wolfiporia cocos MD-104 SS10]
MVGNYINFFGGSPLNRLSWLRTYQSFLNAIVPSPATRWLVFSQGQPLMMTDSRSQKPVLARFSTIDVRRLLGEKPFFGQGRLAGDAAPGDVLLLEGARFHGPPIVFLGLHEPDRVGVRALPSTEFSAKTDASTVLANLQGTPFFSLDVSDVEKQEIDTALKESESGRTGAEFNFAEPRGAMAAFDAFDASLFAMARTMVDWNSRNKFCPSCGSPSYSHWAGWKRSCTSLLPWAAKKDGEPCLTAKGLHNFSHPRTDSVVIMAVVNETNDKVLLGRNKNWPAKFYSALAGFIEPGESFEDAVKREMWEEAGVRVWDVQYHSSQPWPYPASLMVGFYAIADSSKPLQTDLDNELDDARWYTRAEVLSIIEHEEGMHLSGKDYRKMADAQDERDHIAHNASKPQGASAGSEEPLEVAFRIPPLTAIAGVLVKEWAYGRAGPGIATSMLPGSSS